MIEFQNIRTKTKRILIIEDKPRNEGRLPRFLRQEGYEVSGVSSSKKGLELVHRDPPNLLLLDLRMPTLSGYNLLKELRRVSDLPVVMMCMVFREEEMIYALELGADDFVTKPVRPRELAARIKAILRRTESSVKSPDKAIIEVDNRLQVNFNLNEVIVDGERTKLHPKEANLLHCLIQHRGVILNYRTILKRVWQCEYRRPEQSNWVRLYISYLRRKIEENPSNPQYILTEKGNGYTFANWK